jgi:hypothetical protein
MLKLNFLAPRAGVVPAAGAASGGGIARLFASKAAAPGQVYGAPGQGKSTTISVVTTIVTKPRWPSPRSRSMRRNSGAAASGVVSP